MRVIVVPYFTGTPIDPLETPPPDRILTPELPDGSKQERMAVLYRDLTTAVAGAVHDAEVPIVYAGDCLASIGVLAGLQQAGLDPSIAWFDAHGDFHTWETTQSQFLGGMPLAMLVGRGEQTIVDGAGLRPIPEERAALIGARDLDPGEDDAVATSRMTVLSVEEAARWTPPPGPIHLHVDLDVVDPVEMPAHNYPAPGGPSLAQVRAAMAHIAATGRVAAVSFSCWNPAKPGAEVAAAATRRLAGIFLDRP
jgi:arginase